VAFSTGLAPDFLRTKNREGHSTNQQCPSRTTGMENTMNAIDTAFEKYTSESLSSIFSTKELPADEPKITLNMTLKDFYGLYYFLSEITPRLAILCSDAETLVKDRPKEFHNLEIALDYIRRAAE
jgi:hypothetical protein